MTKFEFLAVLRSIDFALEKGTKEEVRKLIAAMIQDAEGNKKSAKESIKESAKE